MNWRAVRILVGAAMVLSGLGLVALHAAGFYPLPLALFTLAAGLALVSEITR